MDENDDQFYDSLDEMPEILNNNEEGSTSCLFMSNVAEVQSSISHRSTDDNVASMIPLYGGEVQKNDRKTKNRRRLKRIPKSLELLESNNKEGTKSYVALFRSRIGYPTDNCRKTIPDSARALDGDATHRTIGDDVDKPTIEVFEDAQTEASEDTESFYENVLKNGINANSRNTASSNTMTSVTTVSLTSSSIVELHSVSEQAIHSSRSFQQNGKKIRKHILLPEPVVGRLGPDILAMKEKLENWKRRQSYGLTASQRNRIKIKESKTLKELRAEVNKEKTSASSN